MTEILTFDAFPIGQSMGSHSYTIDQEAFDRWISLYPDDEAHYPTVPPSMCLWPDVVTAGGENDDKDPGLWKVWVKNQGGEEVIGGTARLPVNFKRE
jgi:hypothetical protein